MNIARAEVVDTRPIEYWISRSTDPFLDEKARNANIDKLCERVNSEADGASIATNVLSHKIVGPDQDEAINALKVVDRLVRKCGYKVHILVGKFRFLNQMVKLVTPKYLGTQTSNEVKEMAIKLLYTWQRSMRHVGKFKEVYDSLKEHKLIVADPIVPEEDVMVAAGPPQKLAVFEDEEKARLLKELLKSNNPEDLQAANRLIKSLVRSEDQKMERISKRYDDLDHARRLCKRLEEQVMEKSIMSVGLSDSHFCLAELDLKIKALFEELLTLRPTLFRYAGEAAETDDTALADVLSVNDMVNKLIQKYKDLVDGDKGRPHTGGTLEETADLLGGDASDFAPSDSQLDCSPASYNSNHMNIIDSSPFPKQSMSHSPPIQDYPDVPFIGFDRNLTPALPRKNQIKPPPSYPSALADFSSFMSADIFAAPTAPPNSFKIVKPSLNDLSITSHPTMSFCSPITTLPTPFSETEQQRISSLPESITFNPNSLALLEEDPVILLDKQNIRIMMYKAIDATIPDVKTYMLVIVNTNVCSVENISILLWTSSKHVTVRLQSSELFTLPGISPTRPVSTAYRIVGLLPLADVKEMELDFSLSFHLKNVERTITGSSILLL